MALAKAEKVFVSQTCVGVREAVIHCTTDLRTPLFKMSGSRCKLTIVLMAHKSKLLLFVGNPGIFKGNPNM